MNVLDRLKNAYASGGIKEIVRKAFFHYIYIFNSNITRFYVNHSKAQYGLNNNVMRKNKVIVSMTSFPPRFEKIHLCLRSLLLQSVKPDKIVVYLGCESSEEDLTKEMLDLKQYGIEYRFYKEKNLRSHLKYFFAMQEFQDDVVVTADDDLYYPSNWLSSLLKSYRRFPNAVSARRVHRMKRKGREIALYNHWEDQCRRIKTPCSELIATGCGGVLYPPHCLPEIAFDESSIKELCFEADDIWLKCMEILGNVPVVWAKNWEVDLLPVEPVQKVALSSQNVDYRKNDIFLKNVMDRYNISVNSFVE